MNGRMTNEWAKFWLAIGVMVVGGGLFANVAWGEPLEIGALSQWVSAAATVAAIWVALHNAQLANFESDRRDRLRQEIADKSYIASVRSLAKRTRSLLKVINEHLGSEIKDIGYIKDMSYVYDDKDIYDSLRRIPLHNAPDDRLVEIISDLILAVKNVRIEIDILIEAGVDAKLSIQSEILLADSAFGKMEKYFPPASRAT